MFILDGIKGNTMLSYKKDHEALELIQRQVDILCELLKEIGEEDPEQAEDVDEMLENIHCAFMDRHNRCASATVNDLSWLIATEWKNGFFFIDYSYPKNNIQCSMAMVKGERNDSGRSMVHMSYSLLLLHHANITADAAGIEYQPPGKSYLDKSDMA
jgi:hypothetical protein